MNIFVLLLLMALFAFADRGAGGGFGWSKLDPYLPSRPLYWYGGIVALFLFAISLTAIGRPADTAGANVARSLACVTLGWIVYRSFSWKLFGGAIDPATLRQDVGFFGRHMLVLIPVAVALLTKLAWRNMLLLSPLYAGLSVMLGMWVHRAALPKYSDTPPRELVHPGKDVIPYSEIIRGALFGALLFSALTPSWW